MARILFTWELGTNNGHLTQQLLLARELRARGHSVLFAACNIATADSILTPERFEFIQAPAPRNAWPDGPDCASYGEILAGMGFGQAESLHACVLAWHAVFRMSDAEIVIASHAPLSIFSARLYGMPVIQLALGFEIPPDGQTLPVLRPWEKPTVEKINAIEKRIVDFASDVAEEFGQPRLTKAIDIFQSNLALLATFPELDHFGPRRNGQYIGPLLLSNDGQPVAWPAGKLPKVFAYLRPNPTTEKILEQLRSLPLDLLAVLPGMPAAYAERFATPNVRLRSAMVQLAPALEQANLILTYAGHGMVSASLLSGLPIVAVPTNVEQLLCSRCIERLNAGIALGTRNVDADLHPSIEKIIGSPKYLEAARAFAAKYKDHDQSASIRRLAGTVERLAAEKKQPSMPIGAADGSSGRPGATH